MPGGKLELAARIPLTPARYASRAQIAGFYQGVVQELGRQPGVAGAAVSQTLPMSGEANGVGIDPRDVRSDDPEAFLAIEVGVVGPGFFRALRIPLLAGRSFTDEDREGTQPVVIVNAALAQRLWPNESPIGRTLPGRRGPVMVVGEIGNVHYTSLTDPVKPEMYLPFTQAPRVTTSNWVIARAARDPLSLAGAVRGAVAAVDSEQPVATLTTLSEMVTRSTAARSFNMTLVGVFALLALGLAVVGVYGVTAYTVEQRTQEIGVRVALGAGWWNVVRLVLGGNAVVAGIGIAIGLAGALGFTRVLGSLLYDVSVTDGATFIGTTVVLAGAAILAALVPALRAARVDPVRALRSG
jgi:predicted permease